MTLTLEVKDEKLEYEIKKDLEDIITHSNTISFEEFEQKSTTSK